MHLGQIRPNGGVIAAVFERGMARPITAHTLVDLICRSEAEGVSLGELAAQLASRHPEPSRPVIPIQPREVWACGGTYAGAPPDARPGIYFKGTARVCVGPGRPIGIRPDSRFTAPEPQLALVLGSKGRVAGYTLANNVSARDIESESPLYLPQSRIYNGSCALGPAILTADELPDPYKLEMTCAIERDGKVIFSGKASTERMARRFDELLDFLLRANHVPAGSVLLTGGGMVVPESAALAPGDVVSVSMPEIGTLSNRADLVA
ncbi:MAG: fumarylacetoacetate hydrolase family protein [Acidobacteria bacterium]|nr:fumarylacetoacetate hydrolase family protein [Acidobacteriota bacterium]